VPTDIAETGGAQQGVGDGVQQRIGIRMTLEPVSMLNQ